ncbi:hypothetical protein FH972_017717 [Carpinus fangiana]|uniref:Uncharacterized protein n=1 Tax=Carpinus fangiana TaxID=176857 RepID=A0A5N6RL42_9ROSI|nr:hypothetical protein FH972_017717 [Carpinus fangiana]
MGTFGGEEGFSDMVVDAQQLGCRQIAPMRPSRESLALFEPWVLEIGAVSEGQVVSSAATEGMEVVSTVPKCTVSSLVASVDKESLSRPGVLPSILVGGSEHEIGLVILDSPKLDVGSSHNSIEMVNSPRLGEKYAPLRERLLTRLELEVSKMEVHSPLACCPALGFGGKRVIVPLVGR